MEISIDVVIHRREYHTVHVDIDCHEANVRNDDDLHDYINEHVHVLDHTTSSSCYESECTDFETNDVLWDHEDFAGSDDDETIDTPMSQKTAPRPDLFLS